jgi:hypothetical protein
LRREAHDHHEKLISHKMIKKRLNGSRTPLTIKGCRGLFLKELGG